MFAAVATAVSPIVSLKARDVLAPSVKVGLALVSSSRSWMVVPKKFPPPEPDTMMDRGPSAVVLPAAVTVTETESCPATSVTWWSVVFPSVSAGVTA